MRQHLCLCGCKTPTDIAPRTRAASGWVRGEPMPRIPGHRTPAPKRDKRTGCLIWQGRVDENGYGKRGSKWAHRVAYEQSVGPIPPGYEVDHLCGVPLCVEPTHLEAVPKTINLGRMPKRDRCPQGHLLEGDNLYHLSTRPTARICRICKNAACARAHARRRERLNAEKASVQRRKGPRQSS